MKTCTKCGEMKEASEFYEHLRDGLSCRCKRCVALLARERYVAEPGKYLEKSRLYKLVDAKRVYLGRLCPKSHDHEGTGLSMRNKRGCLLCKVERTKASALRNRAAQTERYKARRAAGRAVLDDAYVLNAIRSTRERGAYLSGIEIPAKLIEVKREHLRLVRLLRELK